MKTHKNKQNGFTLIEILVVVAVIGMLSITVLTALNTARAKGRDARRKADMIQMQKALELYYNTHNSYPSTSDAWWNIGDCGNAGTHDREGADGYVPNLAPNFLPLLPMDPLGAGTGCAGFSYRSDGIGYKILSSRVGSVGPESFPSADQHFYNPQAPTTSWMLCSVGNTSACAWSGGDFD